MKKKEAEEDYKKEKKKTEKKKKTMTTIKRTMHVVDNTAKDTVVISRPKATCKAQVSRHRNPRLSNQDAKRNKEKRQRSKNKEKNKIK